MNCRISVIIPQHHDEDSLERLIKSLNQQETDFSFDIIVISNPPSPRAEALLRDFKNVTHVQTADVGVNIARNLGLENASGELVLFLDSDCELRSEDFLKRHNQLHSAYPAVSCIGGGYTYEGSAIRDLAYNYIQMKWLLQGQDGDFNRYLIGGNFSCKRHHLDGVRFDPQITYGGSETEFFLRVGGEKGLIFKLISNLVVLHNTNLSLLDFIEKAYKQGRGASYIYRSLYQGIENIPSNKDLLRHEESSYRREMDFWLALYDSSYNQGYMTGEPFTVFKGIKIFLLKTFHFYRIKASDFFGSLENLLSNLPKK